MPMGMRVRARRNIFQTVWPGIYQMDLIMCAYLHVTTNCFMVASKGQRLQFKRGYCLRGLISGYINM